MPSKFRSMDYSQSAFFEKTRQLKMTQVGINEFSVWIMKYTHRLNDIIRDWQKWIDIDRSPQGVTKILYAANDVIQNGRKVVPNIAKMMLPVIEDAFRSIAKLHDERLNGVVIKLLGVWQDRNIYSKDQIKQLHVMSKERVKLEVKNAPRSPKGSHQATVAKKPMKVAYDAEAMGKVMGELTHLLGQLADPPSANLDIRMKISNFPSHIGSVDALNFVKDNDEASRIYADVMEKESLVRDYCRSLSQEVMNRRQKLNLLEEYLKHIRATSDRYVEQMQWLKLQRELAVAELEKIEAAYTSLPDDEEELYNASSDSLPSYESLFIPPGRPFRH